MLSPGKNLVVKRIVSNNQYDAIIIGCGIAGATLSWHLHSRGYRLLVVDDRSVPNASKAAAGIMSPMTGKRHTTVWRWQDFWPEALSFYQQLESTTQSSLLRLIPQLRFLTHNPTEEMLNRTQVLGAFVDNETLSMRSGINHEMQRHGAIEIPSAILNVSKFLDVTFDMLNNSHRLHCGQLPYEAIDCADDQFVIEQLDAYSKHLVFCEGAKAANNPWFDWIKFEPVRGESMQVRTQELPATYVYQQGIALVPTGADTFIAGATYDWENLDSGPTAAGATQLREKIAHLVAEPFTVSKHRSGVRPVVKGRRPVSLKHASVKGLWLFNGLASRGCLQAPFLAKQLAAAICDGETLDSSRLDNSAGDKTRAKNTKQLVDIESKHGREPRLTTLAQDIVGSVITPGDIVIDATAGNGNDTCFLAGCTGADGKVFAFDVQRLALQRTAKRLSDMQHEQVELLLHDHAKAVNLIPATYHGKVAAVMFNLGYLPGSDQNKTTLPSSTCRAISSLLSILRPGGICTILCYRGHPGGAEETSKVEKQLAALPVTDFLVETYAANKDEKTPLLLSVTKH